MGFRVGIDIGGTFTDIICLADDGAVFTAKIPSTPDDYSRGIADGIRKLFSVHRIDGNTITRLSHGTTVATNAILEKRGVCTALITTDGFRDVLEVRRLRTSVLYDIFWQKPRTLVDRALRFTVNERINHRGEIERPLDAVQAAKVVDAVLSRSDVKAIAICLLNAYANGEHEQRLYRLICERNSTLPVCLSSEVLPEMKEYERTSTTVVNAYILPIVERYLRSLTKVLVDLGIKAPLHVMQSSGGVMGADAAAAKPINIIESGPAAGVVGAAEVSRILGFSNVLTFDMGGTTAKASVIEAGRFGRLPALDVGGGINLSGRLLAGAGYTVRVPAIDIAEVGAGGGSLVVRDAGGSLRVGPESAGAVPGPVCYDQGGTSLTVTDANVVLGFLSPKHLAGGSLPLNYDMTIKAMKEQIADPLGLSVENAAWGIHLVANSVMARALSAVSTERGRDPREFALMVFGGNGPVHGPTLAQSLDIERVLVPPAPGLFSAMGLLFPATEHHYVRTLKCELDSIDLASLDSAYQLMQAEGRQALHAEGFSDGQITFDRSVDMRYEGENSELTVPFPNGADIVGRLRNSFEQIHDDTYGYRAQELLVEIISLRLAARGVSETASVPASIRARPIQVADYCPPDRPVYFGKEKGWILTPVVTSRTEIGRQGRIGPLIVEEYDATTVVPPGCHIRLDDWDMLVIDVGRE